MNKDKKQELRAKTKDQLVLELTNREKKLVEVQFKFSQGQLKDFKTVSKKRNEIAVIKTILTEKEQEELKAKEKKETK